VKLPRFSNLTARDNSLESLAEQVAIGNQRVRVASKRYTATFDEAELKKITRKSRNLRRDQQEKDGSTISIAHSGNGIWTSISRQAAEITSTTAAPLTRAPARARVSRCRVQRGRRMSEHHVAIRTLCARRVNLPLANEVRHS